MIKVNFPEKISLNDIDIEDDSYSISFPKDIERLKGSIKEIGLLTPLILRQNNGRKKLQIIAGYKRSIALNAIGAYVIPAYIFNKEDLSDENALKMSLFENLYTREINTIEISNFLFKLSESVGVSIEKIINVYLPLLRLEKSFYVLKKYLSLQNLTTGFKELAIIKKIHLKTLSKFSSLSSKDQESVFDIIKNLELGYNFISELLTLLEEISKRNGDTISNLVSTREITDILSKEKISRDQKTNAIMSFLKDKRYPNIQEYGKKLKEHIINLNLPKSVLIDIPENIETDAVKIRIKFKDKKSYQEILEKLIQISDSEDFKKILEII